MNLFQSVLVGNYILMVLHQTKVDFITLHLTLTVVLAVMLL